MGRKIYYNAILRRTWCFCLLVLFSCSNVILATAPKEIAESWFQSTRCKENSVSDACKAYERCKSTHRCPRANEDYHIRSAQLRSYDRRFQGGERTEIPLMNDFEDWKTGTHHWKMKQDWNASRLLRLNTFNFTIIGSLELADGYLVFDTDKAELFGDFNLEGVLSKTDDGTTVAVFNFMTIYLGKGVKVRFQGSNAVVIMSRSSVIIDTELQVRPGTLGGFPGGGFVGTGTRNNNLNGPGSTNSRVYVKTLSTFGSHIPEIQEIETSCTPGQKIQGHFQLSYGYDSSRKTQLIPFDATADDVKRYLETAFKKIGSLHVERVNGGNEFAQVGRKWIVTFLSAVGNVPQLKATSRLTGLGSKVETRTIREGNEISGTFTLKFLNNESRAMPHDISSIALRKVLLTDFPFLLDARVERTDSTQSCLQGSTIPSQTGPSTISGASYEEFKPKEWLVPNEKLFETSGESYKNYEDKLCSNGRGAAGGFVWKLQFWTKDGNMVSTSTTSPQKDVTLPCEPMIVTPTLVGAGAIAEVVDSMCFSLAFGGAGASYAAQGGFGYSSSPHGSFGTQYSTVQVQDLIGGSGGAGGGMDPIDIFPVVQPTLGGAGGGAIMLTAVNDILIGSNGKITANGAPGRPGFTAGGGGSGGTILITSGATIAHHGIFESIGGDGGNSWPVNRAPFAMPGGGGSGGRIAIYAQSYSSWGEGQVRLNGGKQGSIQPTSVPALVNPEDGAAGAGSFYVEMQTNLGIRVDPTIGAAGTSKSLLIDGVESYESGSTGVLHAPSNQYARSGPRYVLRSSRVNFTISTPSRITYFVRMGNLANGEISKARGALFGVHDVPLSLDNINNLQGQEENKNRMMISIGLVDGNLMHEANTHQFPRQLLMEKIQLNRWYKVDLFLNWPKKTYSIQLNDVIKVSNVPFVGKGVDSISLSNFHQMSTWWDEIYVGYNHLMGFVCPTMTSSSSDTTSRVLSTRTRRRKLWSINALGSNVTTFHEKVLHESHLSKQEKYKYDPNTGKNAMGMLQFDGESHRDFFYDIRERETEEDPIKKEMEEIFFAEFLEMDQQSQDASIIMPFEPISKSSSTIYWYSEVFEEDSSNSTSGTGFLNGTVMGKGAIGACSTRDYNEWRNEGLMIHFINLTDPFGKNIGGNLLADRPKVIYNQDTNQFVMWMHVDNATNTMGLSGVAVSSFPNGPFQFQRSFYPDAPLEAPGGRSINETHDQTIAMLEKKAFLIRTYYKTVEYWLPRSVMNPLWESVKNEDGSVNFGLSYHRAFYHEGYDDPNDIYLQRWRMEDRPWEVLCCQETQMSDCKLINDLPGNHSASLDVENPLENLFKTRNESEIHQELAKIPGNGTQKANKLAEMLQLSKPLQINSTGNAADDGRDDDQLDDGVSKRVCPVGMVRKETLGQGQNGTRLFVTSRYKDPIDPKNSFFIPNSVSSHTSWGFQVYNIKTWRGNYFDALSTNITQFIFHRYAGEARRQQIEKQTLTNGGASNVYAQFPFLETNLQQKEKQQKQMEFNPLEEFTYPNEEESIETIEIQSQEGKKILDLLLGKLGIPLNDWFLNNFSEFDRLELDLNNDRRINDYEISSLIVRNGSLSSILVEKLRLSYLKLKNEQIDLLDFDQNGQITYIEFEKWLGIDPNLLFDRFDLDKNGFLDENELARLLQDRQIPRIDQIMILLDPSFDGRVYYQRFQAWIQKAPEIIFDNYDFDQSHKLNAKEMALMLQDLTDFFAKPQDLQALFKNDATNPDEEPGILRQDYITWFSARTSLIGEERNHLKIDNAVHGTRPDTLSGPLHLVETRRAKYAAISALSDDYLTTKGLLKEIEGDFEGREALIHFFGFETQLFGLKEKFSSSSTSKYRTFLFSQHLQERSSYWNGRHWEGRTSAPSVFTYGQQCINIAGTTKGCAPCLSRSLFVTSTVDLYQSTITSLAHCENQKELDAYIKNFDQEVSIQLQYQQQSVYGSQGIQPHYSPCWNQTQIIPCDIDQQIAWEKHPNNQFSSQKIRANNLQQISIGPTFNERFPTRVRMSLEKEKEKEQEEEIQKNTNNFQQPDQYLNILGGGS